MSRHEAYAAAWQRLVEKNPFPATLGRVCPHPCEAHCTRSEREGAVAINALERFIGDWAIAQGLRLQRAEAETLPESVGVVGAGPAGLSFAYQMARRGYRVTVYERSSKPGGMLMHGIPEYRLPEEIVAAEVQRILDLGVELRLDTGVGRDVSLADLRARHPVLFLGIGPPSRPRGWASRAKRARASGAARSSSTPSTPASASRSGAGWWWSVAATAPWTPRDPRDAWAQR